MQNFSFSFHCMCDDRLLLYKFISIFHILLPGIPSFLSQSAEEMRHRCWLRRASWLTKHVVNMETIFFSSFSKIIPNKDKNKSYKHCNNTFKWKHTSNIIYPQCAETSNLLQMVKKNACLPSVRQSATLSNTQLYKELQPRQTTSRMQTHKHIFFFCFRTEILGSNRWEKIKDWTARSFSSSLLSCSPEGVLIGVCTYTHIRSDHAEELQQ